MNRSGNSLKHECFLQWTRFKKHLRMMLFIMYTWTCAMIFLVVADQSFMPKDGSVPTTWQHVQVFATSGFLWITIGGGGILFKKIFDQLHRFHVWYASTCLPENNASWIDRNFVWILSSISIAAMIFFHEVIKIGNLPFWSHFMVVTMPPFLFSTLYFCTMCRKEYDEFNTAYRNQRFFWLYTSIVLLALPVLGIGMSIAHW